MNVFQQLAVDLGSSNTRVFSSGSGIVLNEPSVIALNAERREVVAVGTEAGAMIGRTPMNVNALNPVQHGTVTDLIAARALFRYFLKALHITSIPFFRPGLIICIPYSLTDMERRVLVDVAVQAGFSESATNLLEQPVATAVASGMNVNEPNGRMIVDVGGGLTEVSVVSMGGVVTCSSTPFCGGTMNEQIISYVKREQGLVIGEHTAEQAKIRVANAYFDPFVKEEFMTLKGRDAQDGLPREAEITNFQVAMAIRESVDAIAETVMKTMDHTPPELASDILHNGVILSGGGALLRGLDIVLSEKTGLRVSTMEDPACAVVNGAGIILNNMKKYRNTLVPLHNLF